MFQIIIRLHSASVLIISYAANGLLAGGNWNNATNCSSQSRNSNNVQSNVNAYISGRGSIREIKSDILRVRIKWFSLLSAGFITVGALKSPEHKTESVRF